MVGVAVNVTFVPAQIVLPGLAAILTDGTTFVFTVTVNEQLTVGAFVILYVTVVMTSSLACANPTTATSNGITMVVTGTVIPSVSIAADPGNTICAGLNVIFTATPTNGGTPSYQWKLNGNNVGTNSNTYSNNGLANSFAKEMIMTTSLIIPTH